LTADSPEKKKSPKRELMEWAACIGLAVVLALAIHTWLGQLVTVNGPSMEPNLYTGEKVLVGKPEYYFVNPKRGDIVLVRYPGSPENFIKRVIALGGETLSVSNGVVFINGKALEEPYVASPAKVDMDEITVPQGSIFVMGDNRNDSTDSRDVGPIPLEHVVGRAYWLAWPPGKIAKLSNYLGKLEQ
jgi:signal peptidase I